MTTLDLIEASNGLSRVPGLCSTHVAEAEAAMSSRYRPHRLVFPKGNANLDFHHHAVACEGASLNLLRYGPDIVVDAGTFDTFYMLEFPLSGGVDILYGDGRVSSRVGSGLILSPGTHVRSNWLADTTQIMLRLERDYVERAWQRFTGEPVRRTPIFAAEIDLGTLVGRRIGRLIRLMMAEQIETDTVTLSPMPLVNAVLETIFEHVPSRTVATVDAITTGPLPSYVRRFKMLLDDPAELKHSVGELSARLNVTPRTLSAGMRRFTGFSPHEYLTMRRMERARILLERSDLTVVQIAQAVGCDHAGRFAATFRNYYGTNPSRLPAVDRH